jgi:hypothetical protein
MALTLVAHDGFGGSEFTNLSGRTPDTVSAGGVWVNDAGSHRLGTGGAKVGHVGTARSYISDTLNADHACSMDLFTRASYVGVLARYTIGSTSDYDFVCYLATWQVSGITLWELAGGSNNIGHWSSLGTASPSFSAGDTLYIEAVGSSLAVKVNGVSVITVTDSAHAAGNGAIFTDTAGDNYADNYKTYQEVAAPTTGGAIVFNMQIG